jgi:hypothetical protein
MEDALALLSKSGDYEELYEVVKTAIAYKAGKTYRVEVLKSFRNQDAEPYSTACCVREEVGTKGVWVDYHPGWTRGKNPDEVLARALGFLPNAQGAAG